MLDAHELVRQRTGEALKQLRQALGISQDELGSRISASRSLIAQFETGRLAMSDERFEEIVEVLLGELRVQLPERPAAIAYAATVLALSLKPDRSPEEADHLAGGLFAFQETMRAIRRLTAQWARDIFHVAPDTISPLTGLCLLYPAVEIPLLLNFVSWKPGDRRREATMMALDSHLFFAMFLAHTVTASVTGGPPLIPGLIVEGIAKGDDAGTRSDRLVIMRGICSETIRGVPPRNVELFRTFLGDLVERLDGALPTGEHEIQRLDQWRQTRLSRTDGEPRHTP